MFVPFSTAQLNFKSVTPSTPAFTRAYCMAAAPSSPPSTADANDIPPPSSSAVRDGAPSASSAIDFLSICHRLKVLLHKSGLQCTP